MKVQFYMPEASELWWRQELLCDPRTMAYNNRWGGVIDFPEKEWEGWLSKYNNNKRHIYFYVLDGENEQWVGDTALNYEKEEDAYRIHLLIHDKFRGCGYGKTALKRLIAFASAKLNANKLIDSISSSNEDAIHLFMVCGFKIIKEEDGITYFEYNLAKN